MSKNGCFIICTVAPIYIETAKRYPCLFFEGSHSLTDGVLKW